MRLTRSAVLFVSFALPLAATSTALASSSVCDATAGNLVTNCGFETGDFTGWTVVDPSSNTYVNSYAPNSGNYSAQLGAFGGAGTVSQTITDTAGQAYNFTFYLENEIATDGDGNPYPGTNAFGVSVIDTNGDTDVLLAPTSIDQTADYELYSYSFIGTGSDTIQFSDDNEPSYYSLDDVTVNEQTPEPSSLALMGTGALVFAGITRRTMGRV